MLLTSTQMMERLAEDGAAIIKITGERPADAPVATCDNWTLGELADHMINMWRFVAATVAAGQMVDPSTLSPLTGTRPEQMRHALDEVLGQLGGHEADEPAWSFVPHDQTYGMWQRQVCHEAAIHRYDAESAAGTLTPLDAALAVDAIDETFNFAVAMRKAEEAKGSGQTIHLHATDIEGEWLITRDAQGCRVTREHAKGDVAAKSTASQLLLLIWGRIAPEDVNEVFGDTQLLHDWQREVRFA